MTHGRFFARAGLAALLAVGGSAGAVPAQDRGARAELVIAASTDIHGWVRGWDYFADSADARRGMTRIATIFDSIRTAAPGRSVFVDAGDFLQGNALTYVASRPGFAGPHPVVAAMNALRYDAVVIGNHEFNYGLPFLDRALADAKFPLLASNVRRVDGKRGWAPAAFFDRAGVRIAIVGVTTPWSMVWDKLHLQGKLQIDDVVPSVRRAVKDARAAGAQVVIVVSHAGLQAPTGPSNEMPGMEAENPMAVVAREVPGIDAIVLGHTHAEFADTTINGVLLVQPRNWATSVAVATLAVEREGKAWRVAAKRGTVIRVAGHAERQDVLDGSAVAHAAARKYATATVGATSTEWRSDSARTRDTPVMDFIGEVMRRATGADLASTAVFSTNIAIPKGPLTVAQIARLYPYDNTMRVVKMSGATLKAFLERSAQYYRVTGSGADMRAAPDPTFIGFNFEVVTGASYDVDLSRPSGDRVVGLAVKGRPVVPTDSFTIALSNYRASGTGGFTMVADARVVKDDSREVRQLLIDEITKKKDLRAADYFVESWHLGPPALAAQVQQAIAGQPEFEAVRRPATAGGAGKATTLRILSTNDFHGALEARMDGNAGRRGGAGHLASVIRRLERECTGSCASVLVDGGDLFQGTPASNLAFGRPVVALYNALGYAATAVGNHDFDWSQDTLRARMREARFAMLAANVTDAAGKPVPWIRPDTIVERGGLKVGLVGLALLSTPITTMPSNVATLRFLPGGPIVAARAKVLRARGADAVIVVAHASFDCDSICHGELADVAAQAGSEIDAIIGGHSHNEVPGMLKDVPLMRARSSGRAVAVVDLPVARSARGSVRPRVVYVPTDSIAPDTAIERIVAEAVAPVREVAARPIATNAEELRRRGAQHPLGNLIADAQRAAGGTDVAVMNNGGIRANLAAGPVTFGQVYEVQPFGNMLMRLTATGTALKAYLERIVRGAQPNAHVSGVLVRYDPSRPAGDRIVEVKVGGVPLDPARTYTVTMSDFMATGGDGLALAAPKAPVETGIADIDAFITYVRALPGGIIRADPTVRLQAVP